MLKNNGVGSSNNWSRVCDTCRSAPCIVYCHAESAYMCSLCDARVHAPNLVTSWHERVWVCELCERAPAAFLCKADAATLCSSCDAHIHSSDPQACSHHRIPILPITGSLLGDEDHDLIDVRDVSLKLRYYGYEVEKKDDEVVFDEAGDEAEAASWLLPYPVENSDENEENNNGFLFGGEVDKYYLDQFNDDQHSYSFVPQVNENYAKVSVVPVECGRGEERAQIHDSNHFQPVLDFGTSEIGWGFNGTISQNVSISPMDDGFVTESTSSDASISYSKPLTIGTSDLFPHIPMTPLEREARVLRYREKKKIRKFGKKIRYASRKAYAEIRPRVNGRFVKEIDVEAEEPHAFHIFNDISGIWHYSLGALSEYGAK
ncbi:hypothetical protein RIF29_19321 [Crotalaria pallida]|uniref:CONSTANS-like protein n=1 Tax=Crotalaria pallida TaxID=3830 RepID=A0AAN9F1S4_CROPI